MKITQFEQSGILIETNSGFKLAIDIGRFTPLEKIENLNPDAVLVSHIHEDHFSIEHIVKLASKKIYLNTECINALGEREISSDIVKVSVGDTCEIGDLKVYFFDVDHGPNVTVRPKENFGFLIEVDNQKVYFAGDMFYPSGIDVTNLEVDIALIPVGTYYTFGPKEAVDFVKQFKKIGEIIPMHYFKQPETKDIFIDLLK
jgi:L-ascorbate metabolism protein UlaG (beta-lactamase superfamily)